MKPFFEKKKIQCETSFNFLLLCKSMDWFLYDNGLHHERVNIFHKNSTEEPFHRKNVNNAMSDDGDFISKFLQQTVRKKEVQLTLHGLGH